MKSAILVEGSDAAKFLQGQLTCDIHLLNREQPLYGAHCNLKGRVEALYDIFLIKHGIVLVTEAKVIDHALEKLAYYSRFSKVNLSVVPIDPEITKKYADVLAQDLTSSPPHARLHPETLGRYLPQELGLDQYPHAVSFTKGCYLGQEIVARLHYLGKLKKELVLIDLDPSVMANPGDIIETESEGLIEIIDINHKKALALKSVIKEQK